MLTVTILRAMRFLLLVTVVGLGGCGVLGGILGIGAAEEAPETLGVGPSLSTGPQGTQTGSVAFL